MANSEETIPLKDRYESLKLLCSEQVLANELLKDEIDRLRKRFNEISKHRTFLLDKLLTLQSTKGGSEDFNSKRASKSANLACPNKRPPASQKPKESSSYGQKAIMVKGSTNEQQSYDESDRESDSWQQGDFYNGWEDNLNVPSYRRSLKQPKKRPSASRSQQQSPVRNSSPFKRPRMGGNGPSPYPPSNSSRNPLRFQPSDDCSLSLSPSEDYSAEPPLIYSAAKNKSEMHRSSASVAVKSPHNRFGGSPNILKSPSSSPTGNSFNSVQISGNTASGTRIYIQKPSVPGNFVTPRMH